MNMEIIYLYGHVLLPALFHAVIAKINQWKIDLTSIYYFLCGTQVNSNQHLEKKVQKHTTVLDTNLLEKIGLQLTTD